MPLHQSRSQTYKFLLVRVIAFIVLANGIYLILSTLLDTLIFHRSIHRTGLGLDLIILVGLTLIYLSNLLWRRKQTAWVLAIIVYAFYIGISLGGLSTTVHKDHPAIVLTRDYFLPIAVIILLLITRKFFDVRSDIQSFGFALRTILIVYLAAFLFGVIGFQLLDKSDFHQEISLIGAIHRTIDQFGLTTSSQLVPYTRRARLFLDSLAVISVGATVYALISLFQPLKARLGDQSKNRETVEEILRSHHGDSEDLFKVWPHGKNYYFNQQKTAGVSFHVHRGIALVVGDPFGAVSEFKQMLTNFDNFCRLNDWKISFIHTQEHFNPLYKELGYQYQKIGEEAVVSTEHFLDKVTKGKYFRQINNKFTKQGYYTELVKPPHSTETLKRMRKVSDEWLKMPGHAEKGFVMGYFSEDYMQLGPVLLLKDQSGQIQGFLNQIHSYDNEEYSYDLLRQSNEALGNSSDFILMNFFDIARENNIKRVNLGLCPLAGIGHEDQNFSLLDRALKFAYNKGDMIYSFNGIYKFKSKYEPSWSDRYIVYKGGFRGFSRTVTALNVAMKPRVLRLK